MGTIYLTDTFAGVRVKLKATRKEVCPFTNEDVWWGTLIDEKDAKALQDKGVPYSRINVDESIIFDWQIVKSIRNNKKDSSKNAGAIRKSRRRRNETNSV